MSHPTTAHAATVEFTAALVRPSQLGQGGTTATLTLGGFHTSRTGDAGNRPGRFYQPTSAYGPLAARLGTLSAGEILTGTAAFHLNQTGLTLLIEEVARVAPDPTRLVTDNGGGVLLQNGWLYARARGKLMSKPHLMRLEDETPICNATLGMTPRRRPEDTPEHRPPLIPIELAVYGPEALRFAALEAGRYLVVSGALQRRLISQSHQRRPRIEVDRYEALHLERALL